VIVPAVQVTVCPDDIATEPMMTFVPDVPTVRPVTIAVPPVLRNSARAAVPVADAATDSGTPDNVRTPPDTVPAVADSAIVARTPVAPDNADVPMTRDPAAAEPVDAAAT
tara:strand:- start:753 stop:1082 length:330 start_codon:yes stop_codon:yes gene_type:complete